MSNAVNNEKAMLSLLDTIREIVFAPPSATNKVRELNIVLMKTNYVSTSRRFVNNPEPLMTQLQEDIDEVKGVISGLQDDDIHVKTSLQHENDFFATLTIRTYGRIVAEGYAETTMSNLAYNAYESALYSEVTAFFDNKMQQDETFTGCKYKVLSDESPTLTTVQQTYRITFPDEGEGETPLHYIAGHLPVFMAFSRDTQKVNGSRTGGRKVVETLRKQSPYFMLNIVNEDNNDYEVTFGMVIGLFVAYQRAMGKTKTPFVLPALDLHKMLIDGTDLSDEVVNVVSLHDHVSKLPDALLQLIQLCVEKNLKQVMERYEGTYERVDKVNNNGTYTVPLLFRSALQEFEVLGGSFKFSKEMNREVEEIITARYNTKFEL